MEKQYDKKEFPCDLSHCDIDFSTAIMLRPIEASAFLISDGEHYISNGQ